MRIIAGTARGTRLAGPKGRDIRPTLDRIRESLFNILGSELDGAEFLDLFAGTGANGIEALSRGARRCVFVDNDDRSLNLIRRNLSLVKLADRARVKRLSLPGGLRQLGEKGYTFDLIFADPPYKFTKYGPLFQGLAENRLLRPGGRLVVEHDRHKVLDEAAPYFKETRRAVYGDTALTIFEPAGDDGPVE